MYYISFVCHSINTLTPCYKNKRQKVSTFIITFSVKWPQAWKQRQLGISLNNMTPFDIYSLPNCHLSVQHRHQLAALVFHKRFHICMQISRFVCTVASVLVFIIYCSPTQSVSVFALVSTSFSRLSTAKKCLSRRVVNACNNNVCPYNNSARYTLTILPLYTFPSDTILQLHTKLPAVTS